MAWHGGTGTQGEPQTDCCADLTGNRCADDMENIGKQSKPCPSGKNIATIKNNQITNLLPAVAMFQLR